ncbi:hypothetical protein M758_1G159800 [Ceratodon purpureus]|nr:hypothetical protein M758_1G159800 [Ceratodon purpureus]
MHCPALQCHRSENHKHIPSRFQLVHVYTTTGNYDACTQMSCNQQRRVIDNNPETPEVPRSGLSPSKTKSLSQVNRCPRIPFHRKNPPRNNDSSLPSTTKP